MSGLLFRSLSRFLPFSLPGTTEGEEGQQTGSRGPRPAPLAALQNNSASGSPGCGLHLPEVLGDLYFLFSPENVWRSLLEEQKSPGASSRDFKK